VLPNGVVSGKLKRNEAGVLISEVDTRKKMYDASVAWRERAMKRIYHSGTLVNDPRSENRESL